MKKYDFCILRNKEDIIEFERKLYDTYKRNNTDRWIFKNYDKINNSRLQSKLPSHFQEIYILRNREDGKMTAGAAVNFNDKDATQIEKMGFSRIKRNEEKFCEILNFFVDDDEDIYFDLLSLLFVNVIKSVISEKIYKCYTACSMSLKSKFTGLGWEIIETKKITGLEKCLLIYTVNVPARKKL